jgi:hypothetical protein
MSFKSRFLAEFGDNASPIIQQAVVQPLQRYEGSEFAADSALDALAISLAMAAHGWLNALFDPEANFYPNIQPTEIVCGDLSAFITWRLGSRVQGHDTGSFLANIGAICEVMYPASDKSRAATAHVSEFESAEHDPDADLGLKWSRTVRTAVDSLVVGDVDKLVNADNADAIMNRLLGLPATLPYDDVLPHMIDGVMAEMEADILGGPGIWHAPLTAPQIQHAIRYGVRHYGTAALTQEPDTYDVYVEELRVLVTIATVYGRIAAYGGQVARVGEDIDHSDLEQLNFNSPLHEHFGVRLISLHKRLNIVAFDAEGKAQSPLNADTRSVDGGQHHMTCYFPNPTDAAATQRFEISTPRLLGRPKQVPFYFDFSRVH